MNTQPAERGREGERETRQKEGGMEQRKGRERGSSQLEKKEKPDGRGVSLLQIYN